MKFISFFWTPKRWAHSYFPSIIYFKYVPDYYPQVLIVLWKREDAPGCPGGPSYPRPSADLMNTEAFFKNRNQWAPSLLSMNSHLPFIFFIFLFFLFQLFMSSNWYIFALNNTSSCLLQQINTMKRHFESSQTETQIGFPVDQQARSSCSVSKRRTSNSTEIMSPIPSHNPIYQI